MMRSIHAATRVLLVIVASTCSNFAIAASSKHIGVASYYGAELHGHRTASGARFNRHAMTAAHRTLPFGTQLRVTNLSNGKSVVVRVNDRGPFVRRRVLDVSEAAARQLGFVARGTAKITYEAL